MSSKKYAQILPFGDYVHKENRSRVKAIKVTDENIELIHTLWKTPSATVGTWMVRVHANKRQVLKEEQFHRIYKLP